ncbi:MAG: HD domain-containing protein [Candidatus Thalassarchaeaceae archaeon]|jgi:putative hydrolase of HD superfamily|nr:HD domain-containing protein [Candidatus Thalassarchaeaceae archaeon]|tara:strand:- start:481 stop:984 length:504 start_codon:yes stop_codon:yes gene_type:complete
MTRETFIEILGLKELDRAGWLRSGLSDIESVAAHSWGVAFLAFHLCPVEINRNRVMEMAICHDVAEVRVGDITPHDGVSDDEKVRMETEAMVEISSRLPQGELMLELFQEYELGVTPESRFLKLCDKLDMALQSYVYQSRTDVDLSNFRITASKLVVEYGFPNLLRN